MRSTVTSAMSKTLPYTYPGYSDIARVSSCSFIEQGLILRTTVARVGYIVTEAVGSRTVGNVFELLSIPAPLSKLTWCTCTRMRSGFP